MPKRVRLYIHTQCFLGRNKGGTHKTNPNIVEKVNKG